MTNTNNADGEDLRGLLDTLWSGRRIVLATVGVLVALTLVSDLWLRSPTYAAESRVLVSLSGSDLLRAQQFDDLQRAMNNELELATSQILIDQIEDQFGEDVEIDVTLVDGRDVLSFAAASTSAEEAAEIANTFATTFIEERDTASLNDFIRAAEALQTRLDEIDAEVATLGTSADDQLERASLDTRRELLQQRIDDLSVGASLSRSGEARIISPAEIPEDQASPLLVRDLSLAIAAGIVLGLCGSYIKGLLGGPDRLLQAIEAKALHTPILGEIPKITGSEATDLELVSLQRPDAPVVEAYRTIRTSVEFLRRSKSASVIQVFSAVPGEGKTTLSINLGYLLSLVHDSVVVVDCDLRHPRLSTCLRISSTKHTLTSYLKGDSSVDELLLELGGDNSLKAISAGAGLDSPAEALNSDRLNDLLRRLRMHHDVVIVDTSPLLPVADASIIGRQVDGMIMSVGSSATVENVEACLDQVARDQLPLLGIVLNGRRKLKQERYSYYLREDSGTPRVSKDDLIFKRGKPRATANGHEKPKPKPRPKSNGQRKKSGKRATWR